MRQITLLFPVLIGLTLFLLAPLIQAGEAVQWLRGSKGLATATERAGDEQKLLLLDFFHPH